jgi:hypothetical protein
MRSTIILLLFFCNQLSAQNLANANLVWEVDQTTDLQTNEAKAYQATFKTNGKQTLEWIQKKGKLSAVYTIVSMDGTWANVSSAGAVTFLLERNGKNLRAKFERNSSGVFITLIYPNSIGDSKIRFNVKSVSL